MTTKTPTTRRRTVAMAAAVALAGSALASGALVANAADATLEVTAPTQSDAVLWKDDSFTVTAVTGVKWSYKIGTDAAIDIASAGAVKPFETSEAKPASGAVTVIATPTDATDKIGADGAAGAPKEFKLTFKFDAAKFVAPKGPTVKFGKDTLSTLTVPVITGVTYSAQQKTSTGSWTELALAVSGKVHTTAPAAASTMVKVTATPKDGTFTFTKTGALVVTEWIVPVKGENFTVTEKASQFVTKNDPEGAKNDYYELGYVKGLVWDVDGKKVAPKPGKPVKIKPAKKSNYTIKVKATAANGYVLGEDATHEETHTFKTTEETTISAPTGTGTAITLPISSKIKNWEFKATGASKAVKLSAPKGGLETFTVQFPAAGELKAVPTADWTITNAEWTVSADAAIAAKTAPAGDTGDTGAE